MWGGTHFYVHIETLVTAQHVDASAIQGVAGRPQQCVVRFQDSKTSACLTSYPGAYFFLQTLRATANVVHIMTDWSEAHTTVVLRNFGWSRYCTDIRTLTRHPGAAQLTAASANCEAHDLANSVFVVTSAAPWCESLRSQTLEVSQKPEDNGSALPFSTRALLYALCRCISLSEWRVRYPGTPVVCSLALSTATLFNYCRFYVAPDMIDDDVTTLIAAHGGTLVKTVREATHILTRTAAEEAAEAARREEDAKGHLDTESSSLSNSSDSDDDTDTQSSSARSSSSSASTSDGEGGDGANDTSGLVPPPQMDAARSSAEVAPSQRHAACDGAGSKGVSTTTVAASMCTAGSPAAVSTAETAHTPSSDGAQTNIGCVLVTREWLCDSVRALRLLPVPARPLVAGAEEDTVKQTSALLCAMLPPEDAKPLPFSHFVQLAKHYHYDVDFLLDPDTHAADRAKLHTFFKDVVHVIIDDPTPSVSTAKVGNRVPGAATKEVWLCRNERRRDRTAVSAHVRLIASQFIFSMARLKEEDRLLRSTGTQTAAPLTAQVGTNTEAAALASTQRTSPLPEVDAKTTTVELKNGDNEPLQSTEPPAAAPDETSTEAEWRSHLKNVEGKVLKSDHVSDDSLFLTGVSDGVAPAGASSIFSVTPDARVAVRDQGLHLKGYTPAVPDGHVHPSIFSAPPSLAATNSARALLPLPPAPTPASTATSLLAPPVSGSSIFPAPKTSTTVPTPRSARLLHQPGSDGLAHAQSIPMSEGSEVVTDVKDPFTRCFIPTYQLPAAQQEEALVFVRSLPFFAKCPSNTVEKDITGLRCTFATPGGAAYFLSSAKLRFRNHTLEIYPLYRESHVPSAPLSLFVPPANDAVDVHSPQLGGQSRGEANAPVQNYPPTLTSDARAPAQLILQRGFGGEPPAPPPPPPPPPLRSPSAADDEGERRDKHASRSSNRRGSAERENDAHHITSRSPESHHAAKRRRSSSEPCDTRHHRSSDRATGRKSSSHHGGGTRHGSSSSGHDGRKQRRRE